MSECEICGKEETRSVECDKCGAEFCEDCGNMENSECQYCVSEKSGETDDLEDF